MKNNRQERPSRVLDLINDTTEWGMSVSDRNSRRSAKSIALKLLSYTFLFVAALAIIPAIVGLSLMPDPSTAVWYILSTAGFVAIAYFVHWLSRRGPRNALQVDYAACEVRLGSNKPDGTFVRHRVCTFSNIDKVYIDHDSGPKPALCLQMGDEVARIVFQNAEERTLTLLAAQISAARESAKKMPLTTRITSRLLGIEANAREVGQRVRSRVVSRAI